VLAGENGDVDGDEEKRGRGREHPEAKE